MTTPTKNDLVRGGIIVTLGSKQYEIKQLNWGAEREWRKQTTMYLSRLPMYADMLTSLTPQQLLGNQKAVKETVPAKGDQPAQTLEVNLSKLVQQAIVTVTQYPEMAYELLMLYSPQLATPEAVADMDAHGNSNQVLVAFLEVLKLAYPFFGELTGLLAIGRKASATSTN